MLCAYLYSSLFESALPVKMVRPEPQSTSDAVACWAENLAERLETEAARYRERLDSAVGLAREANELLSGLNLFDADQLSRMFDELEAAYAAQGLNDDDPEEADEPCDSAGPDIPGQAPHSLVIENEMARDIIRETSGNILASCNSFVQAEQDDLFTMSASAYAVFELILIQCDEEDVLDFSRDKERMLRPYVQAVFPVGVEGVREALVMSRIVEFKTHLGCYAEIIDRLMADYSGTEYVYAKLSQLIAYFLDMTAFIYADAYQAFLRHPHVRSILHEQSACEVFEASLLNFFANLEHTRFIVPGVFNRRTMSMLAKIVGQYATLTRHRKQRSDLAALKEPFCALVAKLWKKHRQLADHSDMIKFFEASQEPRIRALYDKLGKKMAKALIIEVLQPLHAVKGMPGFARRR